MAPIIPIFTPDQQKRRKAPKPSKTTPKQTKVPQRLFRFDVTPAPAAEASQEAAAPSQGKSKQNSASASAWPFPVVLPGAASSTDLPPPITTSEPQGLGYEYGPEIFIDSADYWEDATPANPSFRPKKKEKGKKKKSKTSFSNGYHGARKGEKRVQVKYSHQRKQWTTNTKEFLDGGGAKRIWITYVMNVEVEEERPVDKDGNVVEDADVGDENLGSRPRAGETNIDVDWSSDDESDSTSTSDSSESDSKTMKKAAKKAVKKTAVKKKMKKSANRSDDSSDNETKKANKKKKDKVTTKKNGDEKDKPAESKDQAQEVTSTGTEAKVNDEPAVPANSEPAQKENDKAN
ncbi:hypothetical protein G7Y79_00051g086510 [Physcia stellaris]|nr:hypothetical protein G7Y79_00051g086510 [Physcia stellaris]